MVAMVSGPFCLTFAHFGPKWPNGRVHGLRGGQSPEKCYGHYGHLVFFTKVLWSRLWSQLWSLWSVAPFVPNVPFCPKCPVLSRVPGLPGPKPKKVLWSLWSPSCLVIKALWSGLWSGYGRYGQVGGLLGKRSDHSDHRRDHRRDHSTFVEKHEVTIVTIALFGVLARGAQGHGTKRDKRTKRDKTGQNETKIEYNTSHAPGARRTARPRHSAKANPKCTFPAPNSIEFGVGKVHFGTEREPTDTKTKIVKRFPLF